MCLQMTIMDKRLSGAYMLGGIRTSDRLLFMSLITSQAYIGEPYSV